MSRRDEIRTSVRSTALGGVMAALAVVIMCLGGMIPLATFVCPVLCMLLLQFVFRLCGRRIGWAWYAAVAILSMLMGPDKEGAAFFVFIGYYPLVKPKLDKLPLAWLWKLLLFNIAILIMYWILINLLGMAALAAEFKEMGMVLLLITLVLGNVTFILLDKILVRRFRRK
ncbi:MAG: hypothetical protein J6V34_05155 [Oscillospiraceae bacterium]|nr:hypothetical protein [Oscillospiraceae bacterium]